LLSLQLPAAGRVNREIALGDNQPTFEYQVRHRRPYRVGRECVFARILVSMTGRQPGRPEIPLNLSC